MVQPENKQTQDAPRVVEAPIVKEEEEKEKEDFFYRTSCSNSTRARSHSRTVMIEQTKERGRPKRLPHLNQLYLMKIKVYHK